MQSRPSIASKIVRSFSRCTLLIPILFAVGCANHLNLIPEGYKMLVEEHPQIAKVAAGVDFPIVVATEPKAKDFPVVFTKTGRVIWSKPFWNKITAYRFALIAEGEPDAICYTPDWATPETDDITSIKCTVEVEKYLAMPLVGMLDYQFDRDSKTYTVDRLYYLVHKQ